MNIRSMANRIAYSDWFEKFNLNLDNTGRSKFKTAQRTYKYWNLFFSFLSYEEKSVFENKTKDEIERQVGNFIYDNILTLPIDWLLEHRDEKFKRILVSTYNRRFSEIMCDKQRFKLIPKFYPMDANIFSMFKGAFPEYFMKRDSVNAESIAEYDEFWKNIFRNQMMPKDMVITHFKDVIGRESMSELLASDRFKYYYNIMFKDNLDYFAACKSL